MTCEHASNAVASEYLPWFDGAAEILASHRGWDEGARELAARLGQSLGVTPLNCEFSRLLVDANRPEGHPKLFSEFTCGRPKPVREALLNEFHRPHWARVVQAIDSSAPYAIVHIGVHSFTGELDGEVRRADLAWLYDPKRQNEVTLCQSWIDNMHRECPELRLRRNYPYRGDSAGLTTRLRKHYGPERYIGIELEMNQESRSRIVALAEVVAGTLREAASYC